LILLPMQKAQLFDIIGLAGLNPLDFEIEERKVTDGYRTILRRANSDCLFIFDEDKFEFSPADEMIRTLIDENRWNYLLLKFMDWLQCLKNEMSTRDKRAELPNINKEITRKVADEDKSRFSKPRPKEIDSRERGTCHEHL
jgi:hypothetical protein